LLSAFLSGQALADVITLTFPLVSGAGHTTGFPLPPVTVGTQTFTIPAGQHIVSATASGILGNTGSTAAVDVDLDGVMVAQCPDNTAPCWTGDNGPVPWSYTYTDLSTLLDGSVTMTYTQTTETSVQLSATTLTIITSGNAVPALSPVALAAMALMMAIGAFVYRRLLNR